MENFRPRELGCEVSPMQLFNLRRPAGFRAFYKVRPPPTLKTTYVFEDEHREHGDGEGWFGGQ